MPKNRAHQVGRAAKCSSAPRGAVTLLSMSVPDGALGLGGPAVRACGQAVVGRPVAPVIWSQIRKRTVISARWSEAVIRWR